MPECDYCGTTFDSEDAELAHLREEHRDELGPIDRRRVEGTESGFDIPTGPLALGLVLIVAAAVVGYIVLFPGGGSGDQPYQSGTLGTVHYHGTINVTIDGQELDFSRPEFQRPQSSPAFHFESGTEEWHVHARGVTVQYALSTIDIDVTADSVTYDGTTYRDDSPDWEVIIQVDGQPIDPATYTIDSGVSAAAAARGEGPHIHVVVRAE